jgi:glycosyltransferase involved in cell wall biosynthesis
LAKKYNNDISMISIFTIAYNEEVLAEKFINHYRSRFPSCNIMVYDNLSTDATAEIFLSHGCNLLEFDTRGKINENLYLHIKNNRWKQASTDWVLVCDVDEWLDIDEQTLNNETSTLIKSCAFDVYEYKYEVRSPLYDKVLLFNRSKITEINYGPGCHSVHPEGIIEYSMPYKLLHQKYLSEEYIVQRHKMYAQRVSETNIENEWAIHYFTNEEEIRQNYRNVIKDFEK